MDNYIIPKGDLIIKKKRKDLYYLYNLENKKSSFVNESLMKLLRECNGEKRFSEIKDILIRSFKEKSLKQNMKKYLERLKDAGFIDFSGKTCKKTIRYIDNISFPPLDLAYLEITNSCNFDCIHCYNMFSHRKNDNELSNEEIKKTIKNLKEMGVVEIVITGGEPLMRENIIEILSYIKEEKMDFSLFTNGLLLDREKINRIAELKPRQLAVSVHSLDNDKHEKITGTKTLDRILENVRYMIEKGIDVRVNSSIFKDINDNKKEINELVKKLRNMGVKYVIVDSVISYGKAKEKHVPDLDIAETIRNMQPKENYLSEYNPSDKLLSEKDTTNNFCGIGNSFLLISPEGNVGLCPVLSGGKFIAGNIRKQPLKEIWENSRIFKWLRDSSYKDISKCSVCKYSDYCRGGCKAKAYMYSGKFQSPDLWTCKILGID